VTRWWKYLTAAVIVLLVAPAAAFAAPPDVAAELETPTLYDDDEGGNADADDPAIWVKRGDKSNSLVIGTAKDAGLFVYDLEGEQVQHVAAPDAPGLPEEENAAGRFNNVDLYYDVELDGTPTDVAVVTDRGRDHLRFYAIDPDGALEDEPLTDVTSPDVPFVFSTDQTQVNEQTTAYGLATWKTGAGNLFAFVSQRSRTDIAKLRVFEDAGMLTYELVNRETYPKTFTLPNGSSWSPCEEPGDLPQFEGMVVDSRREFLYAGQEDVGIWRIPVGFGDDAVTRSVLIDRVKDYGVGQFWDVVTEDCFVSGEDLGYGGNFLEEDVEGLTIYYGRANRGYVLASSQGNDTFVAYKRSQNNPFVTRFRVGPEGGNPDGAQESDGAMAMNVNLGPGFREGLFVTQDGSASPEDEEREPTNFKFVRWDRIADATAPNLLINTKGYRPWK
jgi:3-phytase